METRYYKGQRIIAIIVLILMIINGIGYVYAIATHGNPSWLSVWSNYSVGVCFVMVAIEEYTKKIKASKGEN